MCIPVREKHATTQEWVRFVTRQLLKALEKSLVDLARAKLLDELFVVNSRFLSIAGDSALDIPRSDNLFVSSWL